MTFAPPNFAPPPLSLAPLIDAGPIITVHALAAVAAIALGPLVLLRQRRDRLHRWAGYLWVGVTALAAVSALGIHEVRLLGPFSPIHLLIGLVAVNLVRGIIAARAGRTALHGRIMAQIYIFGLALPGALTLVPWRRMNAVLFGGDSWTGFWASALILAAVSIAVWRAQPPAPGARPAAASRRPLPFIPPPR